MKGKNYSVYTDWKEGELINKGELQNNKTQKLNSIDTMKNLLDWHLFTSMFNIIFFTFYYSEKCENIINVS